jgi:hypothetical protein
LVIGFVLISDRELFGKLLLGDWAGKWIGLDLGLEKLGKSFRFGYSLRKL